MVPGIRCYTLEIENSMNSNKVHYDDPEGNSNPVILNFNLFESKKKIPREFWVFNFGFFKGCCPNEGRRIERTTTTILPRDTSISTTTTATTVTTTVTTP